MFFISTITIVLLVIFAVRRCETTSCKLSQAQYNALKSIYDESAGEEWTVPRHNTKWSYPSTVNAPCEDAWAGVTCVCDNQTNQYNVISLFLSNYNMQGGISMSIGNLSSLQNLDLSVNSLVGKIPTTTYQLTGLNSLHLNSNMLTGSIPLEIGQLLSLRYMYLYSNLLTGTIPSEIGQLTLLLRLELNTNMLNGSIPSEIGQLSLLVDLQLFSNILTSTIPHEIGLLTLLQDLFIYSNLLTGTIPSLLGNLSKLEQLDLNSNYIYGTIPSNIGNLTHLNSIYLYSNYFEGPIPISFSDLKLLRTLYLFDNSLTSSIPSSLGNLSLLQNLFLQSNMISSSIPDALSNILVLRNICLDDNFLSGTIPSGINALPLLNQISLSNNLLSGSIFSSFVSNQLAVLNIANNKFTGSITDDIFNITRLSTIIASGNCFVGTIPNSVCNAVNILTVFDFSNSGGNLLCLENQHVQSRRPSFVYGTFSQLGLTGTIPLCLMQSSTMIALKLSGNKLEGTISSNPTNISSSLLNLTLANNALTGSIPTWIQLHSFVELDLSNNRLDGTLSSDFTIASDQTTLALAVNRLSGPLPHSIVASSANMSSLNVLSGNIFNCNNNNLPALDPSSTSYACGSYDLNISAYTWLVCVGLFVLVTILIVAAMYWHPVPFLDHYSLHQVLNKIRLWQSATFIQFRIRNTSKNYKTNKNLSEVVSFILCSKFITITVLCIALISLFAALPLFVGLHADYAIVSYDYGYLLSIAYLHGIAPVVVVSCLLAIIILVAAVFIPSLIEYIAKLHASSRSSEKIRFLTLSFTTILIKDYNWIMFRSYLIFTLLNLINIVVVMSVNVSYVDTVSDRVNYSRTELLVIQVSVGLFKVVWNAFYVAWSCDWLASFFTHRGSMRSRYMMSIVNYIIAPVISTIVYNESCFYYVFNNQDQVTSSIELDVINYEKCDIFPCFQTISININSKSSPSFVYSYACGSALLVAYTPVFFTTALFYGLFQQVIRLSLAFDNPSRIINSFKNLTKYLMAVIPKSNITSTNDIKLADKSVARVIGRNIIVRLMVQMTIMLTFGLASPILIIPLAFAVIMDCKVSQLLVGKCIYENDHVNVMDSDSDYVDTKTTSINPVIENQPPISVTGSTPNLLPRATQPTIKAELLIMEHLDMQSSWQGLDVCFYPMIKFVMLFWALLFFDMIADEYGTINGIITMACFAILPSIIFSALINSKAMASIVTYVGWITAIDNCIVKMSAGVVDNNSLKHDGRTMDIELSERAIKI